MKINILVLGFTLIISSIATAQAKKEVLFTIDDKPYYTDEFMRIYNKNIDLVKDESQKELNQYLDLYIGYKLKINKANKLGLQNNPRYISELKSYRTQLSKNYTSDSKVTKALIEEAYTRSQKEIKASHILITVDENAAPADTLKSYNQALDLRKRIIAGEKFEDLAVQYSQDPSAKENKGDVGYFSAFRMVYPFETAAYKTKVGDISMPVRTRFGFHLLKVTDSRDNRGEVTVAHIMIGKTPTATNEEKEKAKATIQDIYNKLKQGENFEALAGQFSQDKSSAARGGVLPRFGSGQLSSEEFENVAFGLTQPKSFSEPFETQFGWHIVKLIEKHPVKSMTEMEKELDAKIRKDERSRIIENTLTTKLLKKYKINRNEKEYKKITALVTDKYYTNEWKISEEETKKTDETLVTIEDLPIKKSAFIASLESHQKDNLKIKPINKLVDHLYQNFINSQLNSYYDAHLETEFPEFGNVVEEYRDGLLLFDLMEKEIWEKAKQDTIGLKKYYQENINKYQWKKRADVIVASSTKADVIKEAKKLLKSNKTAADIKNILNTKDVINIMIKEETIEEGAENAKNINMKPEVSNVYQEDTFYFVNKVNKILPSGAKTFEEAKGRIVSDYQQNLEENWINELKKEFKININKEVFENLKLQVKK